MGYMDSMNEERVDRIIEIVKKIYSYNARGGDSKPLFDELTQRLTVAETVIVGYVLSQAQKGVAEEKLLQELDGIDEYLDILKVIGVPLETRMRDLTPAQKKAMDENAEDAKVLRRMVDRWKAANKG